VAVDRGICPHCATGVLFETLPLLASEDPETGTWLPTGRGFLTVSNEEWLITARRCPACGGRCCVSRNPFISPAMRSSGRRSCLDTKMRSCCGLVVLGAARFPILSLRPSDPTTRKPHDAPVQP